MNDQESVTKYWIYFFISGIAIILMLIFVREYFWIALPFVVTTFGKALRLV